MIVEKSSVQSVSLVVDTSQHTNTPTVREKEKLSGIPGMLLFRPYLFPFAIEYRKSPRGRDGVVHLSKPTHLALIKKGFRICFFFFDPFF